MAQHSVNATLVLRNDYAATWASRNPILARGEIGAEIDTGLLKMGDGVTPFNNLNYINQSGSGGGVGDGALITTVNNKLTIANYGRSYWTYDNSSMQVVEVVENDLSQWPSVLELEVKNGVARWVVPKINYDRIEGTIDGALVTLARDPMYSTEATTKNYVDNAIADAIINAPHLKRQVVTELPTSYIDPNTIYMIKDSTATGGDKYKEYILIDNELVQIGDTSVNLNDYLKKPTAGSFTEGNIPILTATGEIQDSGVSINNMNQLNIATLTSLGGVYSSNSDNYISVTDLGFMKINKITEKDKVATDALYVPIGSEFILNGGNA